MSFFGIINVGEAHCDDDCLFNTPIPSSLFISFIRVALCICAMGYGLPWYCLVPSFILIETGGRFQSPTVPSKSCSYSNSNESSFSHCDGVRWEQLSFTIAGRFDMSYLASNISITLLVAFQVLLTGSWAWDVLCLRALVMLGLSCKLTIFLMGTRILSMVKVFSLKSRTTPISCKVCLPMIRSYRGAEAPALYSTVSGIKLIDLLAEYSAKERVISPTFFVIKVPFEVPHNCGTALFNISMYFWDHFGMKRRSPLDHVSSSTLIFFCLTISLSLASLEGWRNPPWCLKDLFRPFFFKFSLILGLQQTA